MRYSRAMHTAKPDIDTWLLSAFSTIDGIEGLYIGDERLILDAWSSPHAIRVNQRLPIARTRVKVGEWQIATVAPLGDAALTANAEAFLATAREEVQELEYKRDMLEASRVREQAAPEWRWA